MQLRFCAGKVAGRNTGVLSAATSEFDFAFFSTLAVSPQPNPMYLLMKMIITLWTRVLSERCVEWAVTATYAPFHSAEESRRPGNRNDYWEQQGERNNYMPYYCANKLLLLFSITAVHCSFNCKYIGENGMRLSFKLNARKCPMDGTLVGDIFWKWVIF